MTEKQHIPDAVVFILIHHYIEALLFTEAGPDSELPEGVTDGDFSHELRAAIHEDCKAFLELTFPLIDSLTGTDRWANAGHDFWLTRNGHGAGFWDGDWPERVSGPLTDAAESFGAHDIYAGDDGLVYSG